MGVRECIETERGCVRVCEHALVFAMLVQVYRNLCPRIFCLVSVLLLLTGLCHSETEYIT